jgi:hypothetical protein
MRSWTVERNSSLVGPRLDAPDAAVDRSSADASSVSPVGLPSALSTSISEPEEPPPAADGRPWKYSSLVNVWPRSFDPTTSPSAFLTSEPSALSLNRTCETPVIRSG